MIKAEDMLSAADEARLIRRAREYDRSAIGELYERHVQPIHRYISLRVSDGQTAEDITSEVFLHALEGLQTFEHRGVRFSAWLYRIAHDRVIDYYRRQASHRGSAELSEDLAGTGPDPHDVAVRSLDEQRLRACLEKLSEDQRLVVILRCIERQPADEVARQLGKTPGAVRTIQHRALAALSRLMEAEKQ